MLALFSTKRKVGDNYEDKVWINITFEVNYHIITHISITNNKYIRKTELVKLTLFFNKPNWKTTNVASYIYIIWKI